MVYTLTPSALTASAAVAGEIFPALFCPSVSKMITLLLALERSSRPAAVASAEPIAVPSSIMPILARARFCRSQP